MMRRGWRGARLDPTRLRRHRRGVQFIEFVILFPFYLLFLLFIIDMGRVTMMQAGIQDATQAVARNGAQYGGLPDCPTNGGQCGGATWTSFQTNVKNLPGGVSGTLVSLVALSGGGATGCSANSPYVTVRATYNYNFLTPGAYQVVHVIASGWTISATATARCEIAR